MAIFAAIIIAYSFMVLAFTIGYYKVIEQKPIPSSTQNKISIVICIRNEAQNLASLFNSIAKISYPISNFEIVAVNDHSTDHSMEILKQYQAQIPNLNIIDLTEGTGKKAALSAGVRAAQYEFIAITDADSTVPSDWLTIINQCLANSDKVVCGPVRYSVANEFERMAALEFGSLVATGIGSAGIGHPILCNAANMAFTKQIFTRANLNADIATGDDIFLLQHAKDNQERIRFVADKNFMVETAPDRDFSDFFNRRKRWASKTKSYKDIEAKIAALIVFLASLSLVCVAILAIFDPYFRIPLFKMFALKFVADYALLWIHFKANAVKHWAYYYPICAVFYPIYITFTALLSLTSKFTWKERKYRR